MMEGKMSESSSINNILDDFMSDIFESITFLVQPITGGIDYLRRMRRLYQIQKELDNISNLKPEIRENFLNSLTDIVSVNVYEIDPEELKKRIENIIYGSKDLKDIFEKLESFSNKLSSSDRSYIIEHSLIRLNGRISSIREGIKSRIWDKNEDSNQLLILDQMFFLIQELVKMFKNKDDSELWMQIVVSLLRIEAFHRGKISFSDLEYDISDLSMKIEYEKLPKNYEVVFEILE